MLGLQIVTGIFLSCFTVLMLAGIFKCEHIMRDVPYGWFIDIFMLMVLFLFHSCYAHLVRGLFYGSYFFPRVFYGALESYFTINDFNIIFRLCITWGQMSYWAATV